MLENVSSVEVHYSTTLIYLILGLIAILAGVVVTSAANDESDQIIGLMVIAISIILIVLYFFSRKYFLTVYSNGGGKISFQAKGMKREAIMDFINKIEKAIDLRNGL